MVAGPGLADDGRMEATSTPAAPPRRLTRATDDRMVAGVAAGVARYFAIDPVIVRVLFAALVVFGGSGIALYLAGWLLVPEDGAERSVLGDALAGTGRRRGRLAVVLAAVLVAFALLDLVLVRPWRPGRWWGANVVLSAMALVGVLVLLTVARRRPEGRSLLRWAALALVSMLVVFATLVAGTVVAIAAVTGVPMQGGVGDRQWRPVNADELRSAYHLGVGNLVVDLGEVELREGTSHLRTTVAIGHLTVRVPADADVSVAAHSGVGEVIVFGDHDDGIGADRSAHRVSSGTRRLVLDAEVGVGQIDVERVAAAG
jgi:phage shock protein PspC (stress-responsive transcriptional regulator)